MLPVRTPAGENRQQIRFVVGLFRESSGWTQPGQRVQRRPPHSGIQSRRIIGRRSDDAESVRRRPPARFSERRRDGKVTPAPRIRSVGYGCVCSEPSNFPRSTRRDRPGAFRLRSAPSGLPRTCKKAAWGSLGGAASHRIQKRIGHALARARGRELLRSLLVVVVYNRSPVVLSGLCCSSRRSQRLKSVDPVPVLVPVAVLVPSSSSRQRSPRRTRQ